VEYDDVVNRQRTVIYKKREEIIEAYENLEIDIEKIVWEYVEAEINQLLSFHAPSEDPNEWTRVELENVLKSLLNITEKEMDELKVIAQKTKLEDYIFGLAESRLASIKNQVEQATGDKTAYLNLLKQVLIRSLDMYWIDHLEAIDYLRRGINLRAYGQQEPLVAYKSESFKLFQELLAGVQSDFVFSIFKFHNPSSVLQQASAPVRNLKLSGPSKEGDQNTALSQGETSLMPAKSDKPKDEEGHKLGRNDLCYCGSGKKYKKCHGK
jgi:preprotein translocase subunit SecA